MVKKRLHSPSQIKIRFSSDCTKANNQEVTYPEVIWVHCYSQKQPSVGVLIKKCSENIQQVYRITLILKCDFNKSCKAGLLKSHVGMGVIL